MTLPKGFAGKLKAVCTLLSKPNSSAAAHQAVGWYATFTSDLFG
jgi:hypothetical protein